MSVKLSEKVNSRCVVFLCFLCGGFPCVLSCFLDLGLEFFAGRGKKSKIRRKKEKKGKLRKKERRVLFDY
jgi:hypothetical protein